MRRIVTFLLSAFVAGSLPAGSAIFLHPDGTGLGHWNAARLLVAGPDGETHWDRLDRLAAYRPHQANWLSTTSHAGATVHAYGHKVHYDSFGMDRDQPIRSLSGFDGSLLEEAAAEGLRTGLVNSGHIAEPGTAVFVAPSDDREKVLEISAKVVGSGTDVIFAGGEVFLLPEGETGFFGREGLRKDGRNLLEEAREAGYRVIHTREELLLLPDDTEKVLGVFAPGHTFNDQTETFLAAADLPDYLPGAPSIGEMTAAALRILGSDPERDFLLVAEEEGTDNFSNHNNARGMLKAVVRADQAVGVALRFLAEQPDRETFLLVGSDSDAGHPTVYAPRDADDDYRLPERDDNGAPVDGIDGAGGVPFVSLPDTRGNRHPFGIAWATRYDFPGSVVTKAHGPGSGRLGSSLDNTGIYRLLYLALFNREPGEKAPAPKADALPERTKAGAGGRAEETGGAEDEGKGGGDGGPGPEDDRAEMP